jgi:hypothetical protein
VLVSHLVTIIQSILERQVDLQTLLRDRLLITHVSSPSIRSVSPSTRNIYNRADPGLDLYPLCDLHPSLVTMYDLVNRAAGSLNALAKRAGVNESVITGLNPVEYDPTNVSHHPLVIY